MNQTKNLKNYIGICLDKSASMGGITNAAMKDFNDILENMKSNSEQHNQETILSVVDFPSTYRNAPVDRVITTTNVKYINPLKTYHAPGGYTPMYVSVFDLIDQFERLPDAKDENVSFLVMVVTDGGENHTPYRKYELKCKIIELQNTGRWTFVFRVPVGHKRSVSDLGVPVGNIQEWETNSRGMEKSSIVTQSSMSSYYTTRSTGSTSTNKFFADLSNVSQETIKKSLVDISSEVLLWPISSQDAGSEIRQFVNKKLGRDMKKGAAFYQLNKTERVVQDYKKIIVRDKLTNAIYAGNQARDLLGLPHDGNISLSPGSLGNYDVFVQSTSVNRKLESGTQLLYWEDTGIPFKTVVAPKPVQTPVPAPVILQPKPVPTVTQVYDKKLAFEARVKKIIAEQLGVADSEITAEKSFVADLGADSLDTVELVMALEDEFGIEIPDEEAEKCHTVEKAINALYQRLYPGKQNMDVQPQPAKKSSPKKRVRNRNTPQEKIRKLIAAHLKTGARNVKNYTGLTIDQIKRLTLAVELSTEFGVIVPIKEISAWTTVSDVIDSVVSRIRPNL